MCGRFTLTKRPQAIDSTALDAAFNATSWSQQHNIGPTQDVPVIANPASTPDLQVTPMQWGLVPAWSNPQKITSPLINARAETAHEKPSFRSAYKQRRCLIPTDGFYEWHRSGNTRQAYYFQQCNESLFYMAGLWERWSSQTEDECLLSFTILTTAANSLMHPYHNRMPVILNENDGLEWISHNNATSPQTLPNILTPYSSEKMQHRPVSALVNNIRNDSPECIAPYTIPTDTQFNLGF